MQSQSPSGWQFWIDRGGTFTDVIARAPDGKLHVHKLLSENPSRYDDAALQGIRDVLAVPLAEPLPLHLINAVRLGTTIATNALLEHQGEPTLFVTTRGFRDAIRIGYQSRPDIFALNIKLPRMLYTEVLEVDERLLADGSILRKLDLTSARSGLQQAYDSGLRSCAIVLVHGFRFPEHERLLGTLAQAIGFDHVHTSHQTIPLMKYVSRGDTTLVDAYLSPLLKRYVANLSTQLKGTRLWFMQSNGGLADAGHFNGKDAILSGPAGGIVGAAKTAMRVGFDKIISFDMGGTSTDVAHFDGAYERSSETEIAGARIRVPMLSIHTVAAGGGSVVDFDGSRFRVGPQSAGASPGPACYRRGGPPTITDCNVVLGKIQSQHFPAVFGENGNELIDSQAARKPLLVLSSSVSAATASTWSVEEVALGFVKIAVQKMANAIKQVSTEKGKDVSEYALQCFGGAGGQHACMLAQSLGIQTILIHPLAGVLSAYGIGEADVNAIKHLSVEEVLNDELLAGLEDSLERLGDEARAMVTAQADSDTPPVVKETAYLRYDGTDFALPVALSPALHMVRTFEQMQASRFGFAQVDRLVILERIVVEAASARNEPEPVKAAMSQQTGCPSRTRIYFDSTWLDTAVWKRNDLSVGQVLSGPLLIVDSTATIVVDPQWKCTVLPDKTLQLTNDFRDSAEQSAPGEARDERADPVLLEVFNNLFMFIAEQMGVTLQNTSHSVNIKERLDFSCAIFDKDGNLIANAPHIPVHLGSMGESVKQVINRVGVRLRPDDVYALNDPYNGGTHLPDITVIAPFFDADARVAFFVAARGHHADIGGITPGSMPPQSRLIEEEGVLLDMFPLLVEGIFQETELRNALRETKYPSRNSDQNVADLKAQVAAARRGLDQLSRAITHHGLARVRAYAAFVQDNAERTVREAISKLSSGEFICTMDSGAKIAVRISVDKNDRSAIVDFSGTSPQTNDNFNAPFSVCKAAVLYVFRTLVQEDIPLNAGCMRPITLVVPEGSMLNPKYPAAVVAGNVETSQVIVDALYGALGLLACSQGTMNNFTFGDQKRQYYETICGGSGAGDGFSGASAIQTHMTNSRLTDPEVLEHRFPVVVDNFAINTGTGGAGKFLGGDGVVRRIRFLEPMEASILSNRRIEPGFGLRGGKPGKLGKNYVIRNDGAVQQLSSRESVTMEAGDTFVVETPGGGGFGVPEV